MDQQETNEENEPTSQREPVGSYSSMNPRAFVLSELKHGNVAPLFRMVGCSLLFALILFFGLRAISVLTIPSSSVLLWLGIGLLAIASYTSEIGYLVRDHWNVPPALRDLSFRCFFVYPFTIGQWLLFAYILWVDWRWVVTLIAVFFLTCFVGLAGFIGGTLYLGFGYLFVFLSGLFRRES